MQIHHHGGFDQVTGSCHELELSASESYLIDCGLAQGEKQSDDQDLTAVNFYHPAIKALFVTHSHLDHVGRIPYLLAAGFTGPIYCTRATARLLPLVIADAIKVGVTRNAALIEGILQQLEEQLYAVDYQQWVKVSPALTIRFNNAGHIMGSAFIECLLEDQQVVVFSGDIGCRNTPLLPDPSRLETADLLLLESTYGDRLHEPRDQRQQQLKQVIERCVKDGGAVLIPAFSIGRTQELLYELEDIWHQLELSGHYSFPEVVVDSPLASDFTELYGELQALWDQQAKAKVRQGRHPLEFRHCHTIDDHATHLSLVNRLKSTAEPVIIIAASGMCAGGRVVNYLKALLPDERTDVLFVGYQAAGTPGRDIQTYGPRGGYVIFDDERITIKAQIHTLGGYSAHADQAELLDFIASAAQPVKKVRLIHGEPKAQAALAEKIQQQFNIPVETATNLIV
ncbi:MBL fold metallo-hydrolase [Idiomarina seosinensis]|uniref:MBL fold metallo-hydrolase RNA specificity domain-containing protein n=1 Tax=Idiomarina seosinensis TaxID=281739 RepID=UPI00384B2656